MRLIIMFFIITSFLISCSAPVDKDKVKKDIFDTEKAFEKMTADGGIAKAFYYYAADNAVIKRENDTLISGKENIGKYYSKTDEKNTKVNWTADFIDVSDSGDIAYTYGKYIWKLKDPNGKVTEYKGVFHTVWKKQNDGKWKYVWD